MIMMLNLGIGLCHPPVGAILFVGCAVGNVTIEQVHAAHLAVLRRDVRRTDAGDLSAGAFAVAAAPARDCEIYSAGATVGAASASITGRAKYKNTRNSAPMKQGTAAA